MKKKKLNPECNICDKRLIDQVKNGDGKHHKEILLTKSFFVMWHPYFQFHNEQITLN